MKRTIITYLLTCFCACLLAAANYTVESRLSEHKFVKIAVNETGICRLTYEELQAMGLNIENISVYGFGGAMLSQDFMLSFIDDLPAVPVYRANAKAAPGGYILFYAQGPISWNYTGSRFRHTVNPYATQGFYFLTDQTGECPSLAPIAAEEFPSPLLEVTTFSDYRLHELDSINLIDKAGMAGGGREFYGECFTPKRTTLQVSFDFPNIVPTEDMRAYIDVAAAYTEKTTLEVAIGQTQRTTDVNKKSTDHLEMAKVTTFDARYTPAEGSNQPVKLVYKAAEASAVMYLNYVELTATRELKMHNNLLFARNAKHYKSVLNSRYHVTGATADTHVWDVTNRENIHVVPTKFENGELTFVLDNERIHELVIFNPATCPTISPAPIRNVEGNPLYVEVPNQNVHAHKDMEMVIITPAKLQSAAERLAEAHRTYDKLSVVVVTDQQLYNEFSSGTPDATAYRRFVKMLYDRAEKTQGGVLPRYLLLFGDGTFDNRKLLHTSGENTLLTYQSRNSVRETSAYACDDYFTWMDDGEGNNDIIAVMDLGVGRLPVNTLEQANGVVDKLINYIQNKTTGNWKSQLCFLGDDGDSNMHTRAVDRAAESVRKSNPSFVVNKIYLDSYQQETTASGESYPLAKNKFDNLLKTGVLLFDYCGHAGYNNITSEGMITAREIREMTNENVGIWVLATCNFANFDAQKVSAAEEAILNPHGGALGVFASCRTVYAAQNEVLNQFVCDSLFAHRGTCSYPYRIGDSFRLGKNASPRDENNLPYILLGDPAIRLHYPTNYQIATTELPDTLRALTVNTIKGCVLTEDGDTVRDFNGKLSITIFDKLQTLTTLDNDQPKEQYKNVYSFQDYPNVLFKGEANIHNGFFTSTFMVPKDIKYNYGQARIVYYAKDTVTIQEAIGHYEDFIVGGSSTVEIIDTVGPELNLYLNNAAFRDGDKTNEFPHFYADIHDEHGINTVGSGIGHDLLLMLDDDPTHTYVLNNYFTAVAGGYQDGQVSYRLSELTEGQHSLSFRAWDLLNNSSTGYLSFEVVKGYALQIFSVLAYPNPVSTTGTITLALQHDKPDDLLQTRYMIYDLSGRKVWEKTTTGDVVTFSAAEARLNAGIYLFRVELKTPTTNYTSKTGKIMVY